MAIQGNFPSIRPSLVLDFANSKRLDPRVTFTRASTATYYDGVTVSKAEENLLLYSQDLTQAAWTRVNVTVTADNTTAPDGTSTADKVEQTSTTNPNVRQSVTVNGICTYSVFIKYIDIRWIRLIAGTADVWFDVQNGVVGTTSLATATITSSADGFYRCTVTTSGALSGAQLFYVIGADADGSVGELTGSYFAWGAQLEQRSSVTAYTATTTQAITNYVPKLQTAAANVARFDHTPTTGAALGLLVEESRVNSLTYSDDFNNAAWVKTRTTVSTNQAIAPDGTLTADNLIPSTDNNTHYTFQSLSLSAIAYTMSVYAKANGYNFVAVGIDNDDATFNLTTGEITNIRAGATASVTSVGNGWYRCSTTRTVTAGTRLPIIYATSNSTNASFAGNAYSGIFIWGAQLEAGSFATSYIPTVASTVTRSADAALMTGTNFSSWYNASEGTVYAEVNPSVLENGAGVSINDETTSNRIRVSLNSTSSQFTVRTSGVDQATLDGGTPVVGVFSKFAAAYKVNDFALSLDAGTVATDTGGTVPVVIRMQIGAEGSTLGASRIRKVAYYPARLTNAQLQAITG